MHTNTILSSIVVVLVTLGRAEPIQVERQYDLSSALYPYTSEIDSLYSAGLSAISSGAQEGLSDASTWLASHTTDVGSILATVTSVGGVVESIVTSVGGSAITLATSGAGVVTSFAGSEFTVIPGPTSTANAAVNVHSVTLSFSPALTALITVMGGTLLGAWLTC